MPTISPLGMFMGITRFTQRNQITAIMRTTFTQRQFVVDLLRWHDNSTFKTPLTKGMLRSILVTNPLPCTTISPLRRFISGVLLIITVAQFLMLFTEPFVFIIKQEFKHLRIHEIPLTPLYVTCVAGTCKETALCDFSEYFLIVHGYINKKEKPNNFLLNIACVCLHLTAKVNII